MSYKFSKEDLIKLENLKNLSNSQLKFISSINSQISFIDVGTLKRIKQIQNIDYDILEKIKSNIPKIDVTALQKALLEITNFHNQFASVYDFKFISYLFSSICLIASSDNFSNLFSSSVTLNSKIKALLFLFFGSSTTSYLPNPASKLDVT